MEPAATGKGEGNNVTSRAKEKEIQEKIL